MHEKENHIFFLSRIKYYVHSGLSKDGVRDSAVGITSGVRIEREHGEERGEAPAFPLKPGVPEAMVGFMGIYTDLKFFIEVRNRKSNLRVIHIEKLTEGSE